MTQLAIAKDNTRLPTEKGDIIGVRATGTPLPGPTSPHVIAEVLDLPMDDFEQYKAKWERVVDFEVVASDPAQDGFRLRLYSTTANAGQAEITKDEAEGFIQSWGGTVHSWGTNEVIFDITIYDALVSQAFWDIDISSAVFSELSYDQGTGVHRIQADYSAMGNNPTAVERYVRRMGLTIVSHSDRVLTYDADRTVVRAAFEKDMTDKARKNIKRCRYYFGEGVVDTIVTNGGYMTTDENTMLSYIKDKVAQ